MAADGRRTGRGRIAHISRAEVRRGLECVYDVDGGRAVWATRERTGSEGSAAKGTAHVEWSVKDNVSVRDTESRVLQVWSARRRCGVARIALAVDARACGGLVGGDVLYCGRLIRACFLLALLACASIAALR